MISDILGNVSPKSLAAVGVLVFISLFAVRWLNTEVKIRQLGGHAKRVKTYLPFGKSIVPHQSSWPVAKAGLTL